MSNIIKVSVIIGFILLNSISAKANDINFFKEGADLFKQGEMLLSARVFGRVEQAGLLPYSMNNQAVALFIGGKQAQAVNVWRRFLGTQKECKGAFTNLEAAYAHKANTALARLTVQAEPNSPPMRLSSIDDVLQAQKAAAGQAALVPQLSKVNQIQPGKQEENAALDIESVKEFVEQWRKSWESGDVDSYLSSYFPKHSPKTNLSYDDWAKDRRTKVWPGKVKKILLNAVQVSLSPNTQSAHVQFLQDYRSITFQDVIRKQLVLRHMNNRWFIYQEDIVRR